MSSLVIDQKKFQSNGYLLVPKVFSGSEIEQFRKLVYEQYEIDKSKKLDFQLPNLPSKAKYNKGDLLSKEKLYPILLDERILKIARTILGSNDIIYFGDSSYQIGTGLRGFHRDNIDRTDLNGPDWKGEYTLIRLGIYLQNHKDYSGGLKIKEGSHKNADGKAVFVGNEIGDVAVWSLKTLHSGNAVRLKFFPDFSINKAGREGMVPAFLKKDQQHERLSLFMTFALKSSHLNRYINEYSLKRNDTLENLRASKYSPDALELAKQNKVEVMKLVPEQNE
ncbi:MAG: phytanoyl-CoA dioxygenase family protein [Bacteroidota bacterium]